MNVYMKEEEEKEHDVMQQVLILLRSILKMLERKNEAKS